MLLWILLGIVGLLYYIGLDYRLKWFTIYWIGWWVCVPYLIIKHIIVVIITGFLVVLRSLGLYKGEIKR